jgi:hypothetical protein
MNKKAKIDNKNVIVGVLLVVVLLFGVYSIFAQSDTLEEHSDPADISQGESGTGLTMEFQDENGNIVEIPSWFSTASIIPLPGEFSIVKRTSPSSCTARTQCTGYATNPNILCWNSQCVLGNIANMRLSFTVTNPSSSQLTFLNVAPTTATPTLLNTALNKTAVSSLAPGASNTWQTDWVAISSFEGTTQTFSITAQGTNEYTGESVTVSDSLQLAFASNPTGSLALVLSNPAP